MTYVDERWPVFWEEAAGSNVRDADGNVYVDMTAGFGVALLGHSHPAVTAAVADQAARLVHGMGDVHPSSLKVELIERLCKLAPWEGAKAVLASTGSEAVEIGLKTAAVASGRDGILAFEGAYHGLTLGSLAVTSRGLFRESFEGRLHPGVVFAPFPEPWRGGASVEECLTRAAEFLDSGTPTGHSIGTVIVEPIQGRAGVRQAPDGFMAELSRLAKEAGALVVADEVLTGMGRCGPMFASEVVGLRPDIVCLGKALGAGLQVSACMARPAVMDAWPQSLGEATHTSTYLGHPLSCAAALAGLEAVPPDARSAAAEERGGGLLAALRGRLSGAAGVGQIRGVGLLMAIELVADDLSPAVGAGAEVASAALREGLLVLPAGEDSHVVELTPALVVTDEQIEWTVEVLLSAIERAA